MNIAQHYAHNETGIEMKALSIRQPWAWAILHAGKDIENRDWPARFRGTILIHAAKGMTEGEYVDAARTIRDACRASGRPMGSTTFQLPAFHGLERGGIVGQVEIVDCVERSSSPWFFGRYGFVLRNARPLPFRPFKGALGFFDVPSAATVSQAT